ncbi:DUF885 family protein [Candidatus Neomarinimicrobiota bacterium]
MRNIILRLLAALVFTTAGLLYGQELNPELQRLGQDYFAWRAVTQPATGDDINRVERPLGWAPDYSPEALEGIHGKYSSYRLALESIARTGWSRADSVDYLLLRSAIERVNWEFNILRHPYRNPDFYVHQTLGAVYELLLIGSPMTDDRGKEIILRLASIPMTIAAARINLTEPVAPYALIAIDNLTDVTGKLDAVTKALKLEISHELHGDLDRVTDAAIGALEQYSQWLAEHMDGMSHETAVGRDNYEYFLKYIALMPYTPEELISQGQLEWNRSVSFDVYESLRQADRPPAKLFANSKKQIKQATKDELAVRKFLEDNDIMTVPSWLQHYINRTRPAYLAPLAYMGVVDDLTSPSRLDEPAVKYIVEPAPDLSFFNRSMAQDPRPIIIHEGVPGHYYHLAISWTNADPIRRHFFDSGPMEGIAFHVEEMLLQFGIFEDRPRTREIIYRFMRLRALRVEVDIKLALGEFTIDEAGKYLARTVPMDEQTAVTEAGFFAYNPGQAITYQIGKKQIEKFLTDVKLCEGDQFSLRQFHDYLMLNGNVPIALQRWEYLGLEDELGKLW